MNIQEPAVQQAVITNVRLLPNGRHTMNLDQWFAVWFEEAMDAVSKGELEDVSVEDLEEAETQQDVENILFRVYNLRIKRMLH